MGFATHISMKLCATILALSLVDGKRFPEMKAMEPASLLASSMQLQGPLEELRKDVVPYILNSSENLIGSLLSDASIEKRQKESGEVVEKLEDAKRMWPLIDADFKNWRDIELTETTNKLIKSVKEKLNRNSKYKTTVCVMPADDFTKICDEIEGSTVTQSFKLRLFQELLQDLLSCIVDLGEGITREPTPDAKKLTEVRLLIQPLQTKYDTVSSIIESTQNGSKLF